MVRLSKLTDYAIVLMTYIAQAGVGASQTARGLSEASGLPLPTVSKVLKMLTRAGLLHTQRGVHGGYSMPRLASEVSVLEIIAAIEGPVALTACDPGGDPSRCDLVDHCPTRSNWNIINERVRLALSGLSLADMARPLTRSAVDKLAGGMLMSTQPQGGSAAANLVQIGDRHPSAAQPGAGDAATATARADDTQSNQATVAAPATPSVGGSLP